MITELNQVYARFGPEVAFEVTPMHSGSAVRDQELEDLKQRLLKEWLHELENSSLIPVVRRAANEAASLAWLTPYPLLVFPALLEEKSREAVERAERQTRIRRNSAKLNLENV